jgi:predicted acetyltransferase
MSRQVEIVAAGADAQPVIENLMQLYIHDMSELLAGTPRCEVEADGRFRSSIDLGKWWQDVDHIPLLVHVDDRLAGFALLNAAAHSGTLVDHNVAEFFIVRKHRRSGVGMAAAQAIFSRYPGKWEVAVMRANAAALAFWSRCIAAHPAASGITRDDCKDERWNGTLFGFEIAVD